MQIVGPKKTLHQPQFSRSDRTVGTKMCCKRVVPVIRIRYPLEYQGQPGQQRGEEEHKPKSEDQSRTAADLCSANWR